MQSSVTDNVPVSIHDDDIWLYELRPDHVTILDIILFNPRHCGLLCRLNPRA